MTHEEQGYHVGLGLLEEFVRESLKLEDPPEIQFVKWFNAWMADPSKHEALLMIAAAAVAQEAARRRKDQAA